MIKPIGATMSRECAFCAHTGKLSNEHIFAKWVRDLFPGTTDAYYIGGSSNRNERFVTEKIDWKAKVVCDKCNNTWMSDIENVHGNPVLTPLVTGRETDLPITQTMARSIAIYAFKTAVVQNHADHKSNPFFPARVRHAFRANHSIPDDVSVWICGIKQELPNIKVASTYYRGQLSPTYHWQMYAFTCQIGHLVIQVLAVKQPGEIGFRSLSGYEDIAILVSPDILPGRTWPGRYIFDGDRFLDFATRWEHVEPFESIFLE
jgi:hypothetical protein